MSRVVIRNTTAYPNEEVRELVRFAFADLELNDPWTILVRIGYTRLRKRRREAGEPYLYGASGRAMNYVRIARDVPKNAAYEILLRIGREGDFPVRWYDRGYAGVEVGILADWRDALVAIAAHEGKHIEEFQQTSGARFRRLTGRAIEGRCDAYAAQRLKDRKRL